MQLTAAVKAPHALIPCSALTVVTLVGLESSATAQRLAAQPPAAGGGSQPPQNPTRIPLAIRALYARCRGKGALVTGHWLLGYLQLAAAAATPHAATSRDSISCYAHTVRMLAGPGTFAMIQCLLAQLHVASSSSLTAPRNCPRQCMHSLRSGRNRGVCHSMVIGQAATCRWQQRPQRLMRLSHAMHALHSWWHGQCIC